MTILFDQSVSAVNKPSFRHYRTSLCLQMQRLIKLVRLTDH